MCPIAPVILFLSIVAFFSPGDPSMLGSILVTFESYIFPFDISNNFLVLFSIISCPNAPNLRVLGSIYVRVPIPLILSFTYSPVL